MVEDKTLSEDYIKVYLTPIMKKALQLAAITDGRSDSNFLQWYGWKRAQELGITIEQARKALEVEEDAYQSE